MKSYPGVFFSLFQLPLRVHGLRHFLTKKLNRFQNNIPLQLHFNWITETLGHSFRPNIERRSRLKLFSFLSMSDNKYNNFYVVVFFTFSKQHSYIRSTQSSAENSFHIFHVLILFYFLARGNWVYTPSEKCVFEWKSTIVKGFLWEGRCDPKRIPLNVSSPEWKNKQLSVLVFWWGYLFMWSHGLTPQLDLWCLSDLCIWV